MRVRVARGVIQCIERMSTFNIPKRILVVDDDPISLKHAARILTNAGWATVLASSGEEAMNRLDTESFDAVVSDVIMPRMTGFELLENILIRFPGTPVILMTASKHDGMREAARVCGAADLLEKPLNAKTLMTAVESGLRGELAA